MREIGIIAHVDLGVIGHTAYELIYAQLETAQIIALECKDINHLEIPKRELPILPIKREISPLEIKIRKLHFRNSIIRAKTNMYRPNRRLGRLPYQYMHQKKL